MQLAMIGLGKMGGNMVERLMQHGHSVVAFDRDPAVVTKYQKFGAAPEKVVYGMAPGIVGTIIISPSGSGTSLPLRTTYVIRR